MANKFHLRHILHTTALAAILLFISSSVAFSQLSNDAITLTLRTQKGIFLDSILASRIDSGLIASRVLNDTVNLIHAFPDYTPTRLGLRTEASWAQAWKRGEIMTGDPYIDSLAARFGLAHVDTNSLSRYTLHFSRPLQMYRLREVYELHPDVIWASAGGFAGDGSRIEFFEKLGVMHFSFSVGWGDCPAGCIERQYWYISVRRSGSGWTGTIEESWRKNFSIPRVNRWNSPAWYVMTQFPSADSILSTFDHPLWWYRRHAVEGLWRFFIVNPPWMSVPNSAHWFELRKQVFARQSEIIPRLINMARNDPDADVRASADTALTRIWRTMVQRNYDFAKTGFSMKLQMNNVGALGRIGYPPFSPVPNPPADSIGLEYPTGNDHMWGGGIWVGGKLDTARSGTGPQRKLVSVSYEGWTGPYYEFYPGTNTADSFWVANRSMISPPQGWNNYWGSSLPFDPISDHDLYSTFTDTAVMPSGHLPLRLKVIQSSHAWNHPSAEGILILEYKLINVGTKTIDSAYIAMFLEPAYFSPAPQWPSCFIQYFDGINTFVRGGPDSTAIPFGLRLLDSSRPLDSLKHTAVSFAGGNTPAGDINKYEMLAHAEIDPDPAAYCDERMLYSVGPFTIRPSTDSTPDTVKIVLAFVSGMNLPQLLSHAEQALVIYNNPPTSADNQPLDGPTIFSLSQNYPNPFNPTTNIKFQIPNSNFVSLEVFNVLGQKVRTLVNEKREIGEHTLQFDASGLPSGVYVYRLRAGEFSESRKMILVK